MTKPEQPKSEKRPRAILAIDPRLGHGDEVTRAKMKHVGDSPEAIAVLQAAALRSGATTTDTVPRRPDFLNTQEHRLARELVGATGVHAVGRVPAKDDEGDSLVTLPRIDTLRGLGNGEKTEDDEPTGVLAPETGGVVTSGEPRARAHLVAVPQAQVDGPTQIRKLVEVEGAASPERVEGDLARHLPAGNPNLPTMEANLSRGEIEEAAEEYDEKRGILRELDRAGLPLNLIPEDLMRQKAFASQRSDAERTEREAHAKSRRSEREPAQVLASLPLADPPTIDEPTPKPAPRVRGRKSQRVLWGVLATVLVALLAIAVLRSQRDERAPAIPTSVSRTDPAPTARPTPSMSETRAVPEDTPSAGAPLPPSTASVPKATGRQVVASPPSASVKAVPVLASQSKPSPTPSASTGRERTF